MRMTEPTQKQQDKGDAATLRLILPFLVSYEETSFKLGQIKSDQRNYFIQVQLGDAAC